MENSDFRQVEEDYIEREWPLDAEGIPHRQAARVVLFDPSDRVLLLRGHDGDDINHAWWFTIGGGLEAGESSAGGALRELREETGIELRECDLRGPVLLRRAAFHFRRRTRRQDEVFFVAFAPAALAADNSGFTALEKEVIDEWRWLSAAQIRQRQSAGEAFYPRGLADYVEEWAALRTQPFSGPVPQITED